MYVNISNYKYKYTFTYKYIYIYTHLCSAYDIVSANSSRERYSGILLTFTYVLASNGIKSVCKLMSVIEDTDFTTSTDIDDEEGDSESISLPNFFISIIALLASVLLRNET